MTPFVVGYWKSFALIALICAVSAYARNRVMRTGLSNLDVAMHAAFSASMALLMVMCVNAGGFDRGYWDEIIISTGYVALGPPRFITHPRDP